MVIIHDRQIFLKGGALTCQLASTEYFLLCECIRTTFSISS